MSAEKGSCLPLSLPAVMESQLGCGQTEVAMQMDINNSALVWSLRSVLLPSLAVPTGLFLLAWLLWDKYFDLCCTDRSIRAPLPPGSMGLPLLGETFSLLAQGGNFYAGRQKKHGAMFKTFLFGEPLVRVSGSAILRHILTDENKCLGPHMVYSVRELIAPVYRGCVLPCHVKVLTHKDRLPKHWHRLNQSHCTDIQDDDDCDGTIAGSTGERHRFLRMALRKAFNHTALDQYCQTMQKMTREAIQNWCQESTVFGFTECKKLIFRAFMRLFMGLDFNNNNNGEGADKIVEDEDEIVQAFETYFDGLFSLPVKLPGSALYKGMQAKKTILAMVERCVRAKQRRMEDSDPEGTDPPEKCALDWILQRVRFEPAAAQDEEDRPLTVQELKMLTLEMFFAGQSSLSSTGCMLLYYLARNPGVMDKLTNELEKFNLIRDCPCNVSIELLSKLTYLDHVVKEVLGISPGVGGVFRKALKAFELNGYQIPKGWTIVCSIRETQAGARSLGEQSDEFLPERWDKLYVGEDPQQGPTQTRGQSPVASPDRGPASQGPGPRTGPNPDAANQGPPPSTPPQDPDTDAAAAAAAASTPAGSSADRAVLDPYGYIPFGRGSRSCPGQVLARLLLKVLVLELVRGCRWRLLNPDVVLQKLPNVHPPDRLPMQVTPFRLQPL